MEKGSLERVDIAEHLKKHESAIKALAAIYAKNRYDREDVEQAITLVLIERHAGAYDHAKGELLSYAYKSIRETVFKELDHVEELLDEGELEELEEEGRVEPVNWHSSGVGMLPSSLTPDEVETAAWLRECLSGEDQRILDASVGRSIRIAAQHLGMDQSTYRRRLTEVRLRVQDILQSRTEVA
jgi:DNA-directed RNA polymerase specialized sigma24 family protein